MDLKYKRTLFLLILPNPSAPTYYYQFRRFQQILHARGFSNMQTSHVQVRLANVWRIQANRLPSPLSKAEPSRAKLSKTNGSRSYEMIGDYYDWIKVV